jgi:roadblock/LC7 domain-containing protein
VIKSETKLLGKIQFKCFLSALSNNAVNGYDYTVLVMNKYGVLVECYSQKGEKLLGEKSLSRPLSPPQIPYGLD